MSIDLKTHNDMVEKIMAENDRLEAEVKELTKTLRKLEASK